MRKSSFASISTKLARARIPNLASRVYLARMRWCNLRRQPPCDYYGAAVNAGLGVGRGFTSLSRVRLKF